LNAGQWETVKRRFEPFEQWLNARPETKVSSLGAEKLRGYLEGPYSGLVRTLLAETHETVPRLANIALVEKLIVLQAYLLDFTNNFVSFPHLYSPDQRAIFEMGSLVMDGRRFNFAVSADNRAEHVSIAKSSDIFILYVQVAAQPTPYEVAIPVTSGGKGNLVVGKRGVFVDVKRRTWDAKVVEIVENPISLSEAILSPFRRIGELISGKIEQLTTTASKKLDATTQQALGEIGSPVAGSPQAAEQSASQAAPSGAGRGALAGGLLAGGGVAIAALSSALAYISKIASEKGLMLILGGVGGALVAFILPSVILAFIKLRRRDLSAILEGSGWAINTRMKLSHRQARFFTERPSITYVIAHTKIGPLTPM